MDSHRLGPGAPVEARNRAPARAFSLLELLITMALILVLFVMMYGSGSRGVQERRKAACQKNLQTVHVALQLYANDNGGSYPARPEAKTSEEVLSLLVPQYTSVTEPFICPGSKDDRIPEGQPFEKRKISYAYYMGWQETNRAEVVMTDRQINTLPKAEREAVFSSDGKAPGNNHGKYGGNLMRCDGSLEMISDRSPYALPLGSGVVLLNPRP